jgi:hypothetical protein
VVFTTAPLNESSGTDGADRAAMATEVGGYPQGGHWAVACVRAVCNRARVCGARAPCLCCHHQAAHGVARRGGDVENQREQAHAGSVFVVMIVQRTCKRAHD